MSSSRHCSTRPAVGDGEERPGGAPPTPHPERSRRISCREATFIPAAAANHSKRTDEGCLRLAPPPQPSPVRGKGSTEGCLTTADSSARPAGGSGGERSSFLIRGVPTDHLHTRNGLQKHHSIWAKSRTAPVSALVVRAAYARNAAETSRFRLAGFHAFLSFASIVKRRWASSSVETRR
jgi:hypothetical protein